MREGFSLGGFEEVKREENGENEEREASTLDPSGDPSTRAIVIEIKFGEQA